VDGTPTAETRARAKEAAAASIMRNFYEDTPADDSWSDIHRRREEIARRTLAECVASGKLKRIAVLYGSWHMPAFQEQLTRELGFRVEATCWLDCIVFEKPAKPAEEK
jgi:hypothetical protein